MKKTKLNKAVSKSKNNTAEAITIMLDSMNQGQRKKILKDENVIKLLKTYGIEVSE